MGQPPITRCVCVYVCVRHGQPLITRASRVCVCVYVHACQGQPCVCVCVCKARSASHHQGQLCVCVCVCVCVRLPSHRSGYGQGGLTWCGPWDHEESGMTWLLNNNKTPIQDKKFFKKESDQVSGNTNVQLYSCDSSYGELSHLGCQNLNFV